MTLCRLTAPFMPFLTEEVYQNLVASGDPSAPESVHLTAYPEVAHPRRDELLALEMELARSICTLGRSARSDAGIPIRQPLASLTVAGELSGVHLSDEVMSEIEEELNVKDVRLADSVERLARRIVRPNPRVLGPKLGARFPAVNRALDEGNYTVNPDGSVTVAGELLGADDVTITLLPLEDQTLVQNTVTGRAGGATVDGEGLEQSGGWRAALAVALDRRISPELRSEGLAREIIRRVQNLRRDAGLHLGDVIALGVAGSAELLTALGPHEDRIRREVGASDLRFSIDGEARAEGSAGHSWRGEMDGQPVALTVAPAR